VRDIGDQEVFLNCMATTYHTSEFCGHLKEERSIAMVQMYLGRLMLTDVD
jgi:hypothetical protein